MTNQGGIQAAIRARTGKALDYNGDWHAMFDLDGIPSGPFNGRLLQWIGELWMCMKYHWDAEDYWLMNGIGPKLVGVFWDIGLNDASSLTYAPDAATHKARMDAVRSAFQTYCNGGNSIQHVIVRSNLNATGENATALGYVRQAQTDHVAANPGDVLLDVDAATLNVDGVHYNAAFMKTLGATINSSITGWSA